MWMWSDRDSSHIPYEPEDSGDTHVINLPGDHQGDPVFLDRDIPTFDPGNNHNTELPCEPPLLVPGKQPFMIGYCDRMKAGTLRLLYHLSGAVDRIHETVRMDMKVNVHGSSMTKRSTVPREREDPGIGVRLPDCVVVGNLIRENCERPGHFRAFIEQGSEECDTIESADFIYKIFC
jgi:hypothetical protein